MSQIKKSDSDLKKIGEPNYINSNCWLAKTINASPIKRCWYCETTFQKCPAFRYLIITLVLIPLSICFIFLTEGEISVSIILLLFLFVVSYGYFVNKSTEELVVTNFSLRKTKQALEESRSTLKVRVKARTKELQEFTNSLEQQIKEKTKELQKRVEELEKFQKFAVGRELKMVELKKEVKKSKEKTGKEKK